MSQSRFLEAPFVRMLRMRSASLKTNRHKQQKEKTLTLDSWLQTYQILTNDDQMVILRLSYFVNMYVCVCENR